LTIRFIVLHLFYELRSYQECR